ncbi:MAG TPA: hypothetical protein VN176_15945 [Verrucomicrobiae bacterium]|nr:hypothetical protein [Verrucomicrobiae bacterium]
MQESFETKASPFSLGKRGLVKGDSLSCAIIPYHFLLPENRSHRVFVLEGPRNGSKAGDWVYAWGRAGCRNGIAKLPAAAVETIGASRYPRLLRLNDDYTGQGQ